MNPIIIDLPLPPDCLHPNARPNRWGKAKAVASARGTAKLVAMASRPKSPLKFACYRLVFRLPRKRDYDGLGAWVKAYIDGIVDAGVLIDDSEFRPIGIERFSGAKQTEGKYGVRFVIWPESPAIAAGLGRVAP